MVQTIPEMRVPTTSADMRISREEDSRKLTR